MQRSSSAAAYPISVGDLGAATLLVRPEDRERALELIEAAVAGELEVEDSY